MGARNDEQHETNAPERETGGSAKPGRPRRWALFAAMLSAAVLVSSCAPFGPVNEKPVNRLSAGDAVIALRMGKGKPKAGMPGGTSDNWIMLLDERGWGEAGRIDTRYRATIEWVNAGFPTVCRNKNSSQPREGRRRSNAKGGTPRKPRVLCSRMGESLLSI